MTFLTRLFGGEQTRVTADPAPQEPSKALAVAKAAMNPAAELNARFAEARKASVLGSNDRTSVLYSRAVAEKNPLDSQKLKAAKERLKLLQETERKVTIPEHGNGVRVIGGIKNFRENEAERQRRELNLGQNSSSTTDHTAALQQPNFAQEIATRKAQKEIPVGTPVTAPSRGVDPKEVGIDLATLDPREIAQGIRIVRKPLPKTPSTRPLPATPGNSGTRVLPSLPLKA